MFEASVCLRLSSVCLRLLTPSESSSSVLALSILLLLVQLLAINQVQTLSTSIIIVIIGQRIAYTHHWNRWTPSVREKREEKERILGRLVDTLPVVVFHRWSIKACRSILAEGYVGNLPEDYVGSLLVVPCCSLSVVPSNSPSRVFMLVAPSWEVSCR